MTTSSRYRLNQPAVIAEVIDDEAIIVNLDSGAYYSLRNSGCVIWNLLGQGLTTAATVIALADEYSSPVPTLQVAVEALLEQLLAEQLLVLDEQPATTASPPATIGDGKRQPFQPPVLEKFTDMADLLLLDPIHEVDEMGWPHPVPVR